MKPKLKEIKDITILGSTGSIGTQTLDVIAEHPELFRACTLVAGSNAKLLAEQARKYAPRRVIIADESKSGELAGALKGLDVEVLAGRQAVVDAGADPDADVIVAAMVGYSGLEPTIRAIKAGKRIALANKETLVVGGQLMTRLLEASEAEIVPVDSEHSAIFQCLVGEKRAQAQKIILTASGGPFRTKTLTELENVTASDALKHPNWDMGAKVTIDSATMMNKGFEMIEARWLFGCPAERIEVVVHPQSVVHSMVQFIDGSVKAQLGVPDMHLPIRYALSYPDRLLSSRPELTLEQYAHLTFERPDFRKFPLLQYAFDALAAGGTMPCVLNAANEIAVAAFLRGALRFNDMPRLVSETMEAFSPIHEPTYEDLVHTNTEARAKAETLLKMHNS